MTDQVTLRALRTSDAPAVLAAFESDSQMQRQGTVRNLAEAQVYTDRLVGPDCATHAIAIVDSQDVVIGLIGINVDEKNLNGWFWYWIHAAYRGRGLTSRAATAVANWALSDGGLQRLELGHRANNPASARVASAAGFIHEGTERAKFVIDGRRVDVLTYGRLATDPWPEASTELILMP